MKKLFTTLALTIMVSLSPLAPLAQAQTTVSKARTISTPSCMMHFPAQKMYSYLTYVNMIVYEQESIKVYMNNAYNPSINMTPDQRNFVVQTWKMCRQMR